MDKILRELSSEALVLYNAVENSGKIYGLKEIKSLAKRRGLELSEPELKKRAMELVGYGLWEIPGGRLTYETGGGIADSYMKVSENELEEMLKEEPEILD